MNSPATYSFSNSEYTASGAPFSQNLKNAQGESGWRKTQPVAKQAEAPFSSSIHSMRS